MATQRTKTFFLPEPRVLAHRGYSAACPENTMPAFHKAVEFDPDVLETDVRLTRDGRFVVFHDDTLERTTNGAGPVEQRTLDELRRFDAGFRFTRDNGATFPFRGRASSSQRWKISSTHSRIGGSTSSSRRSRPRRWNRTCRY